MIYISAQPDESFFIWQLELQIMNLNDLGITKDQIHVLFATSLENPLGSIKLQKFMKEYKDLAHFFLYQDLRQDPQYRSSVRPHILKKHFLVFPTLQHESIFYHDSDILFSRIPTIKNVELNDVVYVSDTRNYLDVNYIKHFGGIGLVEEMASIIGISTDLIELNQDNTGGAQYILKGIDVSFWEKVERDSEKIYVHLLKFNALQWNKNFKNNKIAKKDAKNIQAWCADMWAVLWNLWLSNKIVKIHPELDFSWPDSPIQLWEEKSIQHYSGKQEDESKYFKKSVYRNFPPWYDKNLMTIPPNNCSYNIVQLIHKRREQLDKMRTEYTEQVIIFYTDSTIDIELYEINRDFLKKYFNIKIFFFNRLEHTFYSCTNNTLTLIDSSEIESQAFLKYVIIPLNIIIKTEDIKQFLKMSIINSIVMNFQIFNVDSIFKIAFSKLLDPIILNENKGKFNKINCSLKILILNNEKLKRFLRGEQFDFTYKTPLQEVFHI